MSVDQAPKRRWSPPAASLLALATAATLALAACGSGESATPEPPASPSSSTTGTLSHLLPADLRDATVALAVPPEAYRQEHLAWVSGDRPDGVLVALVLAAVDLLGLTPEFTEFVAGQEVEEARLGDLPAVFLMAQPVAIFPTDRADIVPFATDRQRLLLREGLEVADADDLCGLTIVATTTPDQEFSRAETSCLLEGTPIEMVYPSEEDSPAHLRVQEGGADAMLISELYGAYVRQQSPELSVGGPVWQTTTWGFIVGKDTGLAEPLARALGELVATGRYEEIMTRYGMPSLPPESIAVNPVAD